jgi:hypothetical protein
MAEDFRDLTILPAYETSLRLLIRHLAALPLDDSDGMVSSPAGKTLGDDHLLELQTVVINICNLPGLSRFLLPSLFPETRHHCQYEPV